MPHEQDLDTSTEAGDEFFASSEESSGDGWDETEAEDDSSASGEEVSGEGVEEGPYDDGWQDLDDVVPRYPGRTYLSYVALRLDRMD